MKLRAALLALSLTAACGPAATPAATLPSGASGQALANQRWDALSARYLLRSFERDPGFAAWQGKHERDGQLLDLSRRAIEAWTAELHRFQDEALAIEEGSLGEAQRFERRYLLANIDAGLFSSERLRDHERSPLVYSNAIDPGVYLTRNYAPLMQRMRAYLAHARGMGKVVDAMLANLKTPLPRTFVDVGEQVFAGMVPYLEQDVPKIFGEVQDDALQRELEAATREAVTAVQRGLVWLRAQRASATESFALGPDLFRDMLHATERIDVPLEVLLEAGRRDLEENASALRGVCAELLPTGTLMQCAALVNEDKPAAGPVAEARAQVSMLRRFVLEHDLVSVPSEEEAHVEEAPPYKRWNQAYIEIPGPYEASLPSTYYIAPPDPTWSAEEQRGYVPGRLDLMFITVHEVWPGHFLQFLHANRVARPFGRVFVGYAFAEGWAHYTEELTIQAGLLREDKRARVGQLLNALLRNVRLVSAIGLHTQGMTVAESEQLFRDKALQDAGNARQQAARGTFDPGYLNYTLGKLIIRKLRDDYTRTRGGRAAYREFHDKLLSFGGPPLPLVREALLGTSDGLL